MLHAARRAEGLSRLVEDIHSPASPDFRYRALAALLSVPGTTALLRALVGLRRASLVRTRTRPL